MQDRIRTLPAALLDEPVRGRHLGGTLLGQELANGPHLLVFLRHLG